MEGGNIRSLSHSEMWDATGKRKEMLVPPKLENLKCILSERYWAREPHPQKGDLVRQRANDWLPRPAEEVEGGVYK